MPGPRPKYAITLASEQEVRLVHLSTCYMAPFAIVQRAQIALLAARHPDWSNAAIAQRLGCSVTTVKRWRQRWQETDSWRDAPRVGTRRIFTPLQRAQVVAWPVVRRDSTASPGSAGRGRSWRRWPGNSRLLRASRPARSAPSCATIRLNPGAITRGSIPLIRSLSRKRCRCWTSMRRPPRLQAQGELALCADEKTSIQARQRVTPTKAAAPGEVVQVADRYKRMGAVQLFCALVVASGLTFAQTRLTKKFADFKAFLADLFQSTLCAGIKVVHLILDNGPPHAPKQLGTWLASLELTFEVHLYWLPTYASWLDQVEIIFSKVQRDVLTPSDFPSLVALEHDLAAYFVELNQHPKPIEWTYTKTKLLTKFASPPPAQLAA